MRVGCLAMFGLALGGLLGAALGVFLGFVWVSIFKTTDFEGYSGMLVFYTFMPLGALGRRPRRRRSPGNGRGEAMTRRRRIARTPS
jgi:hypothetical protein